MPTAWKVPGYEFELQTYMPPMQSIEIKIVQP
jgi:hypothetical protein